MQHEQYFLVLSNVSEIALPGQFIADEINLLVKGTCEKCRLKNAIPLQ